MSLGLDHLPFICTTSFYRISCIVILAIYLSSYFLVPVAVFWLLNVFILIKHVGNSQEENNQNSTWLISIICLFVPTYFFSKNSHKTADRIKCKFNREKIFKQQCLVSLICYIPALFACMIDVNQPCGRIYSDPPFSPVLNNFEFNLVCVIIMIEGIISTILSFYITNSRLIKQFKRCRNVQGQQLDDNEIESKGCTPVVDVSQDLVFSTNSLRCETNEDQMDCKYRLLVVVKSVSILALFMLPAVSYPFITYVHNGSKDIAYIEAKTAIKFGPK